MWLAALMGVFLFQPSDADAVVGVGTLAQQEAVFRSALEERRQEDDSTQSVLSLAVSPGSAYVDPEEQLLARLRKFYPGVVPASKCATDGRVTVVGPVWRKDGRLLVSGGDWGIIGRCTFHLRRRLLGGWRAVKQPCVLE